MIDKKIAVHQSSCAPSVARTMVVEQPREQKPLGHVEQERSDDEAERRCVLGQVTDTRLSSLTLALCLVVSCRTLVVGAHSRAAYVLDH